MGGNFFSVTPQLITNRFVTGGAADIPRLQSFFLCRYCSRKVIRHYVNGMTGMVQTVGLQGLVAEEPHGQNRTP